MNPAGGPLADELVSDPRSYSIRSSRTVFEGRIVSVRQDEVEMSDGTTGERDVVVHPGAVGVIALDEEERVVLIRQYRHPVRSYLWEVPAGLLDVADEPLVETARRELLEEAGLAARRWDRLLDLYASPGGSTETVTIFLARDLTAADRPADFALAAEELDLVVRRVRLDDAFAAVQDGRIRNSLAVAGILAAVAGRAADWRGLRPTA
ncbi:MAG: NUDIX hydrolase [Actinomycetota bacterium]|nr:NUDIX hydrolase [Actinomycetota bacterium]